ncbi:hypothetical protein CERZMDRAFT_95436 [Cercospora zeae-maydis SCOH1-5]|uniref:Uncharacterized protein n=1 Tax=Cercospora zeae-maydis SCOH1-5 TaxID=717836 RepID=A0A6A6FNM3_9PEZI|nr:hypothetical protein CERZMDRAFT_95436 [Cercospora zeae-maydis SCOH1-5]
MFAYLACLSIPGHPDLRLGEPFEQDDSGKRQLSSMGKKGAGQLFWGSMTSGVDFYVAIVPRARNYTVPDGYSGIPPGTAWFDGDEEYSKIELLFFAGAANYTLKFSYVNEHQNIGILRAGNTSPVDAPYYLMDFRVASNGSLQYDTEDSSLGNGYNMRLVSYATIYRSTLDMLGGAYNYVFATSLVNSKELSELKLWHPTAADISNATSGIAYDTAQSLLPTTEAWKDSGRPFLEMLDELFFNITISMASSEALLYNQSSPFAPPPQNYRTRRQPFESDIEIVGNAEHGGIFLRNFSSVARIAGNSNIDADLTEDMAGKDSLPKYMATATLSLNPQDAQLKIGKPKLVETVREVRPYG